MCEDTNTGKDICWHIYFKRVLFQILANEEEKDGFLLTLLFLFSISQKLAAKLVSSLRRLLLCCQGQLCKLTSYFSHGCSVLRLFLWCIKNKQALLQCQMFMSSVYFSASFLTLKALKPQEEAPIALPHPILKLPVLQLANSRTQQELKDLSEDTGVRLY